MKKKIQTIGLKLILPVLLTAGMLSGCSKAKSLNSSDTDTQNVESLVDDGTSEESLTRYDAQFLRLFDTVTTITGYAEDEAAFTEYVEELKAELTEYHQLYDIYNDYEGVNNIKTINENAGIQPVVVDEKILDMLEYAKEMYEISDGKFNAAMGSALTIWHDYRTAGIEDPAKAELPPMDMLKQAAEHIDNNKVIIDREASTVYLADPDMSLDVGAIAKGYATEQVCLKLEADGLTKALVSVGGNVRSIGVKDDGSKWKVGIQNPDIYSDVKYLHVVELEDMSLVSSGSYQRYYTVDGKIYHHIIHPETLMPWDEFVSVSILCRDSGMADALSTSIFNMTLDEGMQLIEGMDNVEAMWIDADKTEHYSSGFKQHMVNDK